MVQTAVAEENLKCPWGDKSVDVRTMKLNEEEKRWLAYEFISGRQKSKDLQSKYHVPASSLWKYVQQVKENKTIHKNGGRPKAIDDTGMNELIEILRRTPDMSDGDLRNLIRTEYQKSCLRQYPEEMISNPVDKDGNKIKRKKHKALCFMSVRRYSEELRKICSY